jgi:hypothetical protein
MKKQGGSMAKKRVLTEAQKERQRLAQIEHYLIGVQEG